MNAGLAESLRDELWRNGIGDLAIPCLKIERFPFPDENGQLPAAHDPLLDCYRELAMKHHPDRCGKMEKIQVINAA